jgi:hypothetical protein
MIGARVLPPFENGNITRADEQEVSGQCPPGPTGRQARDDAQALYPEPG